MYFAETKGRRSTEMRKKWAREKLKGTMAQHRWLDPYRYELWTLKNRNFGNKIIKVY